MWFLITALLSIFFEITTAYRLYDNSFGKWMSNRVGEERDFPLVKKEERGKRLGVGNI